MVRAGIMPQIDLFIKLLTGGAFLIGGSSSFIKKNLIYIVQYIGTPVKSFQIKLVNSPSKKIQTIKVFFSCLNKLISQGQNLTLNRFPHNQFWTLCKLV